MSKLKQVFENDIHKEELRSLKTSSEEKYNYLLSRYLAMEKEMDAMCTIQNSTESTIIKPHYKDGVDESVAFSIASDWHIEERVRKEAVNGLNEYSLSIAQQRVTRFYQNTLKLTRVLGNDTKIKTLVIAHLGDFISGNIHDELLENCELPPIEAALMAKKYIRAGIDLILNNSKLDLIIPCSSGNHSRITKKLHISTEAGNSLEYFIYKSLQDEYNDKRVRFIVDNSYHTYMDVMGKSIRLHHGHALKYGGGVGGIYIPVNKAIAQWNKSKKADLDVFGHFHQRRDGGNFICNGSIIGYNSFALNIKADYEEPQQTFFLLHKTKGKTIVAPVLCK